MISVIVPVYKVEPYLRRCVDSILAQTYTDFELILVDDGSPDNCGAICDEYAAEDRRIRVIHQGNGGLSAARNAGLDVAAGEYITFVDSDDWVHSEYLAYLYRAVLEQNVLMSSCAFIKTNGKADEVLSPFTCTVYDGLSWFGENHVYGVIPWGKLYHKSLFCEIRYPVGKIHEDEFTTHKLLHLAGDVAVIDAKLYYYYTNESGIMNSPYSARRLDGLDAIGEQCAYFKQIGRKDMVSFARKEFIGQGCNHVLRLEQMPNNQPYLGKTRRRLQRAILRWGHSLKMSPTKNKWEYAIAFPKLYHLYIGLRDRKEDRKKE